MDDVVAEQIVAGNGEGHHQHEVEDPTEEELYSDERGIQNVDDSADYVIKHSIDENLRDSTSGKLFVGGIAWETTEDSFSNYFSKYGEITDSVIMMDKVSGRPRGFGFVTFADPEAADRVLEEDHVIDGRSVEVKRTVPREDMLVKGFPKTRKIFVGGIPVSLTEDELKEYFLSYGDIVEHQIMLDHKTGRSRGFGFVTFEKEDAVEKVLADGQRHELGGKQVEIKKAEPKRAGSDFASDSRIRRGGSSSRSYGGFGSGASGYGGKMGSRGYGGYGGYGGGYDDGYGSYGNYGGNYVGGSEGYYTGYGGYGYGFGFGGPMYGGGTGYGGNSYGMPSSYGGGYGGSKGYGGSGGGGSNGGSKGYGNSGAPAGRYHPYRK